MHALENFENQMKFDAKFDFENKYFELNRKNFTKKQKLEQLQIKKEVNNRGITHRNLFNIRKGHQRNEINFGKFKKIKSYPKIYEISLIFFKFVGKFNDNDIKFLCKYYITSKSQLNFYFYENFFSKIDNKIIFNLQIRKFLYTDKLLQNCPTMRLYYLKINDNIKWEIL